MMKKISGLDYYDFLVNIEKEDKNQQYQIA